MAGLFNKLPGFQKTPAGAERIVLRRLPRMAWLGFSIESPSMLGMVDIYVLSLIILHWTVLFTV